MIPIRFGEPSRQLFGLFQPAAAPERRQGVLICNPFGQEAIRSYRLFRVLGDQLSHDGFDVLRFDYFGTGDSGGDDLEGDMPTWVEDVLRADAELVRLSGQSRRSWFGLRLGATLAAIASASAANPPAQLVLLDPVIDGPGYLSELARRHAAEFRVPDGHPAFAPTAEPKRDAAHDVIEEALGFPLTAKLQAQIRALSASSIASCRAAEIRIMGSAAWADLAALHLPMESYGVPISATRIESNIVWASEEAMNTAIVPAAALQAIIESISKTR